jgi:hypothetical protein
MTLRGVFSQSGLKNGGYPLGGGGSHDLSNGLRKGLGGWLRRGGWNYWPCRRRDRTRGLGSGDRLSCGGIRAICRTQSRCLRDSLAGSRLIDGSLSRSNLCLSRSDDLIGICGDLLFLSLLTLNTNFFNPAMTQHSLNTLVG